MKFDLYVQRASRPTVVLDEWREAMGNPDFTQLWMTIAYASVPGVRLLLDLERERGHALETWAVVGLDGYVTEPDALRLLAGAYEDRARAYSSEAANSVFHLKVAMFGGSERFHTIVGSANLTKHGFETNTEAVFAMSDEVAKASGILDTWMKWWEEIWSLADPLSPELIERYERDYGRKTKKVVIGDRLVEVKLEATREDFEQQPGDAEEAATLWIDAGRITGGAETQLQLIKRVAPFFLVRRRAQRRRLTLRQGATEWNSNELKFYAQNDMWRINLSHDLVATVGSLRGRTAMFTRLDDADTYEFKVLTEREKEAAHILARRTGVYGRTAKREYGWY